MDKIKLQEMAFYGHHGVDSEENTLGQRFFIDVEMDLDLSGAGESDNIEDSVNYAEVFSLVQSIAEGTPCKLWNGWREKSMKRFSYAILRWKR